MRLPPAALAALVGVIVVVQGLLALEPPTLILGLVDWTGHFATIAILLAASSRRLPTALIAGTFAATLIDLDHIPDLFGEEGISDVTPRPVSHSMVTVLVAGAIAAAVRARAPRYGAFAVGIALGVAMHLLRDVFTGPGVSLFWPLSAEPVNGAFLVYLVAMIAVAAYAATRSRRVVGPA
ncbi:MAG TPA: metal-dependent hydrolase [Solirubrobacteraceae bacterium]|nr:metal-dependent hydrolase [Solirubrobacteraceae bacterium]